MPASRVVTPPVHWLMLLGALCMLASTLLPLTSSSMGAWSGTHRHLTLNGIVPSHTHGYEDSAAHRAHAADSCVVTDSSASAVTSAMHHEALVCAPDTSGAQSVTATVLHEPPLAISGAGGVESLETVGPDLAWQDVQLSALTPPPRS